MRRLRARLGGKDGGVSGTGPGAGGRGSRLSPRSDSGSSSGRGARVGLPGTGSPGDGDGVDLKGVAARPDRLSTAEARGLGFEED